MRLPSYQDLSREQDAINNLPLDGSYLVVGPPGTGKTVMALYRAEMLTNRTTKVSLLMLSRLLSQYTRDASEELGVDGIVETFHRWMYGFYFSLYKRRYPQIAKFSADWTAVLSQINREPPPKADLPHLIVDEGQDFPKGFYLVARHIAKSLTIFADDNQRINADNSEIGEIKSHSGITSTHKLTRNYRNTKEIAALAQCFYTGLPSGIAEPPSRGGDRPVVLKHNDVGDAAAYIARFEKNNPGLDIGVLVPTIKSRSAIAKALNGKTRRPIEVYVGGKGAAAESLSFGEPGIKLLCYQSAKGLEFDAVFLAELQEYATDPSLPEFKMMFYVMISRARDSLFLMYSGEGEPRALQCFPDDLVDKRV